ncbi:hypothetical protein [Salmonella phage SSBI34]|nr:hypothetical protein [Salmonella phage SSBI34]
MIRDINGLELFVGDKVVFSEFQYHGLRVGRVVGYNKSLTMATIEYRVSNSEKPKRINKSSDYVARVEDI